MVAQTTPPQPVDSEYYNTLWVAHASFQAHRHDDYMTPLLVESMVKLRRRNPNVSYPDLVQQAADLTAKFKEKFQYANTGSLPDPFEREQQIAEWAKSLAKFSKNPLAEPLAEALSDSFKIGSAVANSMTSLDQSQQLEYRSLLYRAAMDKVDQAFGDALSLAKKDPKFRDALNTVLGPTLDIEAGESLDEIKRKSPEIVALMNSEEMLKLLRSKSSDENTQALIEKQLRLVQDQTNSSYALVRQALEAQMDAAARQALQTEIEKKERIQSLEIETARAGLSLILKIVGPTASDDVKRALYLGDAAIRAWEALATYERTMRTVEDSGALAGAAVTFNLVGVMFDTVQLFNQQPSEAEQGTMRILQEINQLKTMVADLYTMTSKRFDRLEAIVESDQRINAESFQILIVRSQISAQDLTSVRSTLSSINQEMREMRGQANAAARSVFDTKFAALQRKCYLERTTINSKENLSKADFETCLQEFATYALDVSHEQPFLGSPTALSTPDDTIWSRLGDPYEEQLYLLQRAKLLGSSGVRFITPVRNAYVWANATAAYVSTLDTWPALASSTDFRRLSQIADAGKEMESAWKSILDVNCADQPVESGGMRPICMPANVKLFSQLLHDYSEELHALGKAANNVATKYAAEKTNFINPFEYGIVSRDQITPADDPQFAKSIPSKTPRCGNDKDLPDYIDTPPGITRLVPPEMRLAERLDPSGHQVTLCYELIFRDRRVMYERAKGMPSWNRFVYFGTPWLTIQAHMQSVSVFPTFAISLPDMFFAWSPTQMAEYSDSRYLGEYWSDQFPPNFTFKTGNIYRLAFPEWLSGGGLATFSNNAKRAIRVGNTDNLESPPNTSIFLHDADSFVTQQLDDRRKDAAEEIEKEFSRSGELQTALHRLSGTKRLLQMFLQVILPVSALDDTRLQTAQLAALKVYDGDLEWQALLTNGRDAESHAWYRTRWYPGNYGPQADTPADRLRYGVEDLVVLGISDTPPDKIGFDESSSLICWNYKRLAEAITDVFFSGRQIPERAPLFAATISLVDSRLAQRPKDATALNAGDGASTRDKHSVKPSSSGAVH
jgi:hypothetical protein